MDSVEGRVHALELAVAGLTSIYENYLDWAAVTVGVLTLFVALFVTAAFGYIKWKAEALAEEAAKETAEQVANLYLQTQLPEIFADYKAFMGEESASADYLEEADD